MAIVKTIFRLDDDDDEGEDYDRNHHLHLPLDVYEVERS